MTVSAGTLTTITPLNLPDAAGYNFMGGDVMHQAPTAPIDWANLSYCSRTLAARDNIIAAKVEQLISQVNNQEQLVPINVPSTYLAPGDVETCIAVRIPAGFQGRVLNSAVNASPLVGTTLLQVLYNPAFGATTGQVASSTYSENATATSFYSTGEFAIVLSNAGTVPVTAFASVLITMEPVVDQPGSLIGPGVPGPQGLPGPSGANGTNGGPGPMGPTGAPGMVWLGQWSNVATYIPTNVVWYNWGVLGVAAYYCIVANSNQVPPVPASAPSAFWDLLAYTPPSAQPIQISPTFTWVGAGSVGTTFGYYQAPFAGFITGASASVQSPAVGNIGSGCQIDLLYSNIPFSGSAIRTFNTVYLERGSFFSGTTFPTPYPVLSGQYIRSQVVLPPGSVVLTPPFFIPGGSSTTVAQNLNVIYTFIA
jgi:hypothetical protein